MYDEKPSNRRLPASRKGLLKNRKGSDSEDTDDSM
jgi:hypothetical protein